MKNLIKNKFFIGGVASVLVIGMVLTAILLRPGKNDPLPTGSQSPASSEASAPDIPDVSNPTGESSGSEATVPTESDISDITVDVGTEDTSDTGSKPTENKKPDKPADPITEIKPPKDDSETSGVNIGGNPPQEEAYNCGSSNHHCQNAEYHAFLLNLELDGCPNCGSHSCKSFYSTNEWGYTLYDPTLCPKYNEKGDPLLYCQKCGKKNGDGSNGTCAQFINACDCPLCGEHVDARTCHTCK